MRLDGPECMAALFILASIASGLRSGFAHPAPAAVAALISPASPEAIFSRLAGLTEVPAYLCTHGRLALEPNHI